MKDQVEDPGGDLRAVEGTDAELAVETDRPLANGALLFDDGTKSLLRSGENGRRIASVPIARTACITSPRSIRAKMCV